MALVAVWMLAVVLSVAIIVLQCTSVVTGAGCLTKLQLEDQFSASPPSSLEFYMHNPGLFTSFPSSAGVQPVAVRRSRKALKSSIITFDNKLTQGSDERSVEMGRAQGIRVVDEVGKGGPDDELAFSWHFTASFQGGRNGDGLNGTLSFQGTTHNFPSPAFSEITVTGGTGVFRFARGYATFNNFYKEEEISTLEGQHFQVFLRY
jgi:hypothetical protein